MLGLHICTDVTFLYFQLTLQIIQVLPVITNLPQRTLMIRKTGIFVLDAIKRINVNTFWRNTCILFVVCRRSLNALSVEDCLPDHQFWNGIVFALISYSYKMKFSSRVKSFNHRCQRFLSNHVIHKSFFQLLSGNFFFNLSDELSLFNFFSWRMFFALCSIWL